MKKNSLNFVLYTGVFGLFAIIQSCSLDSDCQNTWFKDADGDGFGDITISQVACEQPTGYVNNWFDSDDADASINPAADEIPDNNIDENGDGIYDYNLFIDDDYDGYGVSSTELVSSNIIIDSEEDLPLGYALVSGDCNDNDTTINPGATETPDDGIDSNCNGNDND